jgi:hypothetical protein
MPKKPIEERFFQKVRKMPSGCHEWTGSLLKGGGYGQFHLDGKTAYAHIVAYTLDKGPTNGNYVLHSCDNRKCVNPDHLFLGTFDDNMADMVNKGRQAHGVKNPHAKLRVEQVLKIRASIGTHRAIADHFGVSQALVTMIRNKQIWKYV